MGIDVFDRPAAARRIIGWLGFINIALGDLQPHPGLPDGRRAGPARHPLEAARRPARGDPQRRGGRAAVRLRPRRLGVFIALQPGGIVSGLWLAVIGWFLSNAAETTLMQAGRRAQPERRPGSRRDGPEPACGVSERDGRRARQRAHAARRGPLVPRAARGRRTGRHRHPQGRRRLAARGLGRRPRDRHHDPLRRPGHDRPRRADGRRRCT